MRFFCLIFSLYTLTLALTPCADGLCGGDDQHIASKVHEEEKEDDLCSSFCICSCCGYSAMEVSFSSQQLTHSTPGVAQSNSFYKTPHFSAFSIDFWQPPKIG